jgi:hypothetical protein
MAESTSEIFLKKEIVEFTWENCRTGSVAPHNLRNFFLKQKMGFPAGIRCSAHSVRVQVLFRRLSGVSAGFNL